MADKRTGGNVNPRSGKKQTGGKQPGAGRRKGKPNKFTASIKEQVLQALKNKGGVEYLERLADNHPKEFTQLLVKILPAQMVAEVNVNTSIALDIVEARKRVRRVKHEPLTLDAIENLPPAIDAQEVAVAETTLNSAHIEATPQTPSPVAVKSVKTPETHLQGN